METSIDVTFVNYKYKYKLGFKYIPFKITVYVPLVGYVYPSLIEPTLVKLTTFPLP